MSWWVAALLAAVCTAAHYLTLRAAAGRLPDGIGALIVEGSAATGLTLYVLLVPAARQPATFAWGGVGFAVASGLCISGLMALLFYALRSGAPVGATGPLVLGGGVTLAALAATVVFSEGFSVRRLIGVALGLAAVVVLATEPT